MNKYKLLKDLPVLKAGAIFTLNDYNILYYKDENNSINIPKSNQDKMKRDGTFDEWFEEIEESKVWKPKEDEEYWYTYGNGDFESDIFPDESDNKYSQSMAKSRVEIGNCFKTVEDAKKAIEKLKALRRLREKGLMFKEWYCDYPTSKHQMAIKIEATADAFADVWEDLNLLFEESFIV